MQNASVLRNIMLSSDLRNIMLSSVLRNIMLSSVLRNIMLSSVLRNIMMSSVLRNIIIQYFIIFNLPTETFKAYCAICVRCSNFHHQAPPRVSPRDSTQRWKVELWARNVR
jgi:hypothetical protein